MLFCPAQEALRILTPFEVHCERAAFTRRVVRVRALLPRSRVVLAPEFPLQRRDKIVFFEVADGLKDGLAHKHHDDVLGLGPPRRMG